MKNCTSLPLLSPAMLACRVFFVRTSKKKNVLYESFDVHLICQTFFLKKHWRFSKMLCSCIQADLLMMTSARQQQEKRESDQH